MTFALKVFVTKPKPLSPSADLQRNIKSVMRLEEKALHGRSVPERIADAVTAAAGSMLCVIVHVAWFAGWILINAGMVPGLTSFDPFPFSFLTFVVSLEAIFLTLLVLLSQKRIMRDADKRAHLDLQIDMLAEQEGTMTLRLVRRLCQHFELDHDGEKIAAHLEETTDVSRLAKTLEKSLPK
jgi:uncharacterized membrane protein